MYAGEREIETERKREREGERWRERERERERERRREKERMAETERQKWSIGKAENSLQMRLLQIDLAIYSHTTLNMLNLI